MSKILDSNYFQINGWMVNQLKLSGNELMVYAIIYGFSQTEGTKFTGSINYLCDFTNSSRTTIIKCLKNLTEKNLIIKNQKKINGVTFNEYQANLYLVKNLNWGSKETKQGVVKNLNWGSKETVPNNKDNNKSINNINKNNVVNDNFICDEKIIIDYLNDSTGKHFRHNTDKTKKLIKARIREGFTVDDFKRVIDTKTKQWSKDKKMKIYLRPETLFGNKFEGYLNEEPVKEHYDIKIDHSDLQNYNFDDIDF